MTATVVHLCQGRVIATHRGDLRCRNRARWWAGNLGSLVVQGVPTCGTHSRAYRARWPILTDDPQADRQALEDTFR